MEWPVRENALRRYLFKFLRATGLVCFTVDAV
jgi:hypothetical protein